MPLNSTAMVLAANALEAAMTYAQLHSAAAGIAGTNNLTTAPRKSLSWGAPSGNGTFGLASEIAFTGGTPNGAVYSVTLWSASTGGTLYGEFTLAGDTAFDASGNYSVTAIDLTGTAS